MQLQKSIYLTTITFLTFKLYLGVPGIVVSSFVANFNNLFFLVLYMFYTRVPEESLHVPLLLSHTTSHDNTVITCNGTLAMEWGVLMKFSIQSCQAVCLEWWWYELMTISAGYLNNPRVVLAMAGIVIQITSLLYTLPTALSAVSTRVGNELGAGQELVAAKTDNNNTDSFHGA